MESSPWDAVDVCLTCTARAALHFLTYLLYEDGIGATTKPRKSQTAVKHDVTAWRRRIRHGINPTTCSCSSRSPAPTHCVAAAYAAIHRSQKSTSNHRLESAVKQVLCVIAVGVRQRGGALCRRCHETFMKFNGAFVAFVCNRKYRLGIDV